MHRRPMQHVLPLALISGSEKANFITFDRIQQCQPCIVQNYTGIKESTFYIWENYISIDLYWATFVFDTEKL